jgi:hypothetical protein
LLILRVNKGKEYGRCENEKKSVKTPCWEEGGKQREKKEKQ